MDGELKKEAEEYLSVLLENDIIKEYMETQRRIMVALETLAEKTRQTQS